MTFVWLLRSVVERTSSNQGNDAILRYQGILQRKTLAGLLG